jgi:tetratricopeptide (TPR) repeat protein
MPSLVRAYLGKAAASCKLNLFSDALYCYDKAIELDNTNEIAYHHKAFLLAQLNEHETSIYYYDQSIQICLQKKNKSIASHASINNGYSFKVLKK